MHIMQHTMHMAIVNFLTAYILLPKMDPSDIKYTIFFFRSFVPPFQPLLPNIVPVLACALLLVVGIIGRCW